MRTYAIGEQSRAMAAARRASERAAMRLTDVHAVFTAGPELAPGQVVGGPALPSSGSRRTCGTARSERPYCPMGAGGSSEGASRNGMTVLVRSGEKKRS